MVKEQLPKEARSWLIPGVALSFLLPHSHRCGLYPEQVTPAQSTFGLKICPPQPLVQAALGALLCPGATAGRLCGCGHACLPFVVNHVHEMCYGVFSPGKWDHNGRRIGNEMRGAERGACCPLHSSHSVDVGS